MQKNWSMPNQKSKSVDSVLSSFVMEGLNVISQIFSENEIKSLGVTFYEILNDTSISESEIGLNEKCHLVLDDIKIEQDYDPVAVAIEGTKDLDFHEIYLQLHSPKSKTDFSEFPVDISRWEIFYNEDYYNAFCEAGHLTQDERSVLSAFKEKTINASAEAEDLPDFLINEDRLKTFFIYHVAAIIDRIKKESSSEGATSSQHLHMILASKVFVNTVKEQYALWESSSADIIKQAQFMFSLDVFNSEGELTEKQLILALFLLYYTTYSDNWKSMCFEHELSKHCDTPTHTLHFIKELKKHKYCRDFCREYDNYVESNGIKPLFNTTVIVPATPELFDDTNTEHKDWFKKLDKSKVQGVNKNEALYKAVRELYYRLKESGSIPETTSEQLFIYRFTGFLIPQPLDVKIEWAGDKNTLAFMFKCLYTRKDGETDITSPRYTKLAKYFIPELSNGSALADSLDNKKRHSIIAILQECGFVNVDPSKIK